MYRRAKYFFVALFFAVATASSVYAGVAQASTETPPPALFLSPPITDTATTNTYRNSLAMCLGLGAIKSASVNNYNTRGSSTSVPQVSASDIAGAKWFTGDVQVRQFFDSNDGGKGTNCDTLNLDKMLKGLGWSSNTQAACDLGFTRFGSSDCIHGSANDVYRWSGGSKQDVLNRIDKIYHNSVLGNGYTPEQYYAMEASVLQSKCRATPLATSATALPDTKNKGYEIKVVDSSGKITPSIYQLTAGGDTQWALMNGAGDNSNIYAYTCADFVGKLNSNATAYAQWVSQHQIGSNNSKGTCEDYALNAIGGVAQKISKASEYTKVLSACQDGLSHKAADYCNKYPALHTGNSVIDDNANQENYACIYGQTIATGASGITTPTSATVNSGDSKPSCGISGIGWIVCPIMEFLANVNEKAYNFLASNFLVVDTSLLSGTQEAWTHFRDIANIMFVIAFLFVIYSQITSAGISNYGIKRMLPRIIVAAVLVNISFYICELGVDLSNLLGYGIPHFFGSVPVGTSIHDSGNTDNLFNDSVTWIVVIGGIIAIAAGVALAISVPVLVASLLAIGMIVLILIGRQALLVLLVAISPLAFVAYLLPNTEIWFKKWYKLFSSLLLLFPIIGTVFGASRLAALIINNTAAGSALKGDDPVIIHLVALGVSVIPFFIVPSLLKNSLSATGALGAKLSGASTKLNGGIRKKAMSESRLGEAKKAYDTRNLAKRINRRVGPGGFGAINRAIDGSRFGKYIGGDKGAALAVAQKQKATREEIENSVALLSNGDPSTQNKRASEQLKQANRTGDVVAARAAAQVLRNGGTPGRQLLHDTVRDLEAQPEGIHSDVSEGVKADGLAAGMKGYDSAMDIWNASGSGSKLSDVDVDPATIARLNQNELAGQSEKQLRSWAERGIMTQDQAAAVMDAHNRGTLPLDDKKVSIFSARAANLDNRIHDIDAAHAEAKREEERRNPPTP